MAAPNVDIALNVKQCLKITWCGSVNSMMVRACTTDTECRRKV